VERAAGHVVRARFFERHVALDHIHDIEAVQQILNERLRNHKLAQPLKMENARNNPGAFEFKP
jgi:hypothetical protein